MREHCVMDKHLVVLVMSFDSHVLVTSLVTLVQSVQLYHLTSTYVTGCNDNLSGHLRFLGGCCQSFEDSEHAN